MLCLKLLPYFLKSSKLATHLMIPMKHGLRATELCPFLKVSFIHIEKVLCILREKQGRVLTHQNQWYLLFNYLWVSFSEANARFSEIMVFLPVLCCHLYYKKIYRKVFRLSGKLKSHQTQINTNSCYNTTHKYTTVLVYTTLLM